MTKDQCKRDMRFAIAAAAEVRKYTVWGHTIRKGVTRHERAVAAMWPTNWGPDRTRAHYYGLLRRAERRRQELLTHPGGEWRVAGRTEDGRVIYAAPAGTPVRP